MYVMYVFGQGFDLLDNWGADNLFFGAIAIDCKEGEEPQEDVVTLTRWAVEEHNRDTVPCLFSLGIFFSFFFFF